MMCKLENSIIRIDIENCTKCNECVKDCVANLFYLEQDQLQLVETFEDRCIECGHCEAVCPVNVIRLKYHKEEELESSLAREKIPTYDIFLNLVLNRRSIRRFKEKAIPKKEIEKLLEVGRYSPTGGNSENVYFTVVQDRSTVIAISDHITENLTALVKTFEDPKGGESLKKTRSEEEIKQVLDNLPSIKRKLEMIKKGIDFWCWNGELLVIHGDKAEGGIASNSALAAAHIMLAAETLGLGACSLGYLTGFLNQYQKIRNLIEIPSNHTVGYCLTMGYPNVKYKRIPARKPLKVQWF
jgi:nitroreductase/NAD-dependent dihydropyrimidine dehydrogenase PreA subunit